jgi:putative ABC transport system permease protein
MTNRIVVDSATAAQYNLSVGESVYVGSTVVEARSNQFRVVGITDKFSGFLGAQTIGMHLSELQEVSGTTDTDPGSFIAIRVEETARVDTVVQELNQRHPELEFRTAGDQTQAIVRSQQSLTTGGIAIGFLAVVVGGGIAGNTLGFVVVSQSAAFAGLSGLGVSSQTLRGIVLSQGILIGGGGGLVGVGVALISVPLLNHLVAAVTGFDSVIQTPWWVVVGGFLVAVTVGAVAGLLGVWRLTPVNRSQLR